jgi:hypothetical protein
MDWQYKSYCATHETWHPFQDTVNHELTLLSSLSFFLYGEVPAAVKVVAL